MAFEVHLIRRFGAAPQIFDLSRGSLAFGQTNFAKGKVAFAPPSPQGEGFWDAGSLIPAFPLRSIERPENSPVDCFQ